MLKRFLYWIGFAADVPPELQTCESCRNEPCKSVDAVTCKKRLKGELQERMRRNEERRSHEGHI